MSEELKRITKIKTKEVLTKREKTKKK